MTPAWMVAAQLAAQAKAVPEQKQSITFERLRMMATLETPASVLLMLPATTTAKKGLWTLEVSRQKRPMGYREVWKLAGNRISAQAAELLMAAYPVKEKV